MGWDANWASTQAVGKLPRNVLNQLRDALLERVGPVTYPPTVPPALTANLKPYAWFTDFASAMGNITDDYANHTINGGDFEGVSSSPAYTSASLLAAIGDTVRIPTPEKPRQVRAWAWQQYKMLNMLRWIIKTGIIKYTETDRKKFAEGKSATSFAAAHGIALANLATEAWGSHGETPRVRGSGDFYLDDGFPRLYTVDLEQIREHLQQTNPSTVMPCSLDVYGYTASIVGSVFYDAFSGSEEGKYHQMFGSVAMTASETVDLGWKTPDPCPFVGPTPEQTPDSYRLRGEWMLFSSGYTYNIYKFDGLNGFAFRDW